MSTGSPSTASGKRRALTNAAAILSVRALALLPRHSNLVLIRSLLSMGIRMAAREKWLIVISATKLDGVYFTNHSYDKWLREREPSDMIGYSMLVYDIQ